jgi:hypothetical protein
MFRLSSCNQPFQKSVIISKDEGVVSGSGTLVVTPEGCSITLSQCQTISVMESSSEEQATMVSNATSTIDTSIDYLKLLKYIFFPH